MTEIDFGILDSDVARAKALQLPEPYKISRTPGSFRVEPFVEDLPLMDGVIYDTNSTQAVAYDRSWKTKVVAFDLQDLRNFEELKFYDGALRAPANSEKYLKHMYGGGSGEQVRKGWGGAVPK